MPHLNKVFIIGHLGKDPELKFMPSGDSVMSGSIAVSESWKDKQGSKQEHTEWFNLVLYGKRAELFAEWFKKGDAVYIEAKQRTRKWQDKDGNNRYSVEHIILEFQGIGNRRPQDVGPEAAKHKAASADDFDDDTFPF